MGKLPLIIKTTLGLPKLSNLLFNMPNDYHYKQLASQITTLIYLYFDYLWPVYKLIMNLLDQLFQYSLTTQSCSISFSALPQEPTLNLSSINNCSFQEQQILNAPSLKSASLVYAQPHVIKRNLPFSGQFAYSIHKKRKALDSVCSVFSKAQKFYRQIIKKQAFQKIKRLLNLRIKTDGPKQFKIFSNRTHFVFQQPLLLNINEKEVENIKIPYLHPQRRQVQNLNLCDNMNLFLSNTLDGKSFYNSTAYGSQKRETITSQVFQNSIIKDFSQNQFRSSPQNQNRLRSKPPMSHFTVAQIEDTQTVRAFTENQQWQQQLPQFARTTQDYMHHKRQITNQDLQEQNYKFYNQTQRMSPKCIEDEVNAYTNYRRSLQKKKHIALKQIRKSKQVIKKIVYQLQRSKSKQDKQKIKLNPRKGSQQKKEDQNQSDFTSPVRPKSVENKMPRGDSIKQGDINKRCIYTIQQQERDTTNSIGQNLSQFHSISKNLQVYYNYMKAKQNNKKVESSKKNNACKPKTIHQNITARKTNIKHPQIPHINPMVNIKQCPNRSRKIDLKVQLNKPNGKLVGKKNNK